MMRRNVSTLGLIERVGGLETLLHLFQELHVPFEAMTMQEEHVPIVVNEIRKRFEGNEDIAWRADEGRVVNGAILSPSKELPSCSFSQRFFIDEMGQEARLAPIPEAKPVKKLLTLKDVPEVDMLLDHMGGQYSQVKEYDIIAILKEMNSENIYENLEPTVLNRFVQQTSKYVKHNTKTVSDKLLLPLAESFNRVTALQRPVLERDSIDALVEFIRATYHEEMAEKSLGNESKFKTRMGVLQYLMHLGKACHQKSETQKEDIIDLIMRIASKYTRSLIVGFDQGLLQQKQARIALINEVEDMLPAWLLEKFVSATSANGKKVANYLEKCASLFTHRYQLTNNVSDLEKAAAVYDDAYVYLEKQDKQQIVNNRTLRLEVARQRLAHDKTALAHVKDMLDAGAYFGMTDEKEVKLGIDASVNLFQEQSAAVLQYSIAHRKHKGNVEAEEKSLFSRACQLEEALYTVASSSKDINRQKEILIPSWARVSQYHTIGFTVPHYNQVASLYQEVEAATPSPLTQGILEFRHYATARMLRTLINRGCVDQHRISEKDLVQQFARTQREPARGLLDILVSTKMVSFKHTNQLPEGGYALTPLSVKAAEDYINLQSNLPVEVLHKSEHLEYTFRVKNDGRVVENA